MPNPMSGARNLAEFLRRRCAFDKATFLKCSFSRFYDKATFSKFYARHHIITERALRFVAGKARLGVGSLLLHVIFFLAVSWFGYVLLAGVEVRREPVKLKPRGIDLFFTAVSAATGSSMSTVEMEAFSNAQLMVLTVLMFVGGEVFISLVGLAFTWSKLKKPATTNNPHAIERIHDEVEDQLIEMQPLPPVVVVVDIDHRSSSSTSTITTTTTDEMTSTRRRHNAVRSLFLIVLAFLLSAHVVGAVAIAAHVLYTSPSMRTTLRDKSLNVWTFVAFTTVSTFSGCGFMPTNENMAVFKTDTGMQMLLLVPLTLAGNSLFPPLLALLTKGDMEELMEYSCYYHLFPARRCWMLVATVGGFVAVQAAMVCGMEWDGALRGMKRWEKASNAVFMAVNSRHTGESTVDFSTLAPAILVLFLIMMYLPVYTTWYPFEQDTSANVGGSKGESTGTGLLANSTVLSQLSYLAICVIAICITERKKLREDPLNFSVFSVIVEVVSAYGNVGFSMGYSCSRQINPEQLCTDKWTGFAGRWSDSGKLILILVMFFGRMKKFSMKGGKAWKLA